MAREIKAITVQQHAAILDALELLRVARSMLRAGGAPRAAAYVTRAIKSTEGAARHADHRARRQEATR